MAGALSNSTSRLIGALFVDGSATGMTDAQLLDRFVSDRDATAEHAFEVLVRRHGPMVLSVCRSVLGDQHESEDAFQATFLVLARRAASLRDPANLGPWLYGVARRTSQKAKARRSRLERLIRRAGVMARAGSESGSDGNPVHGREEAEMLHEEIGRLPEKYRTPVVLCDLEGLSREEAAKQLGWPMGTLGVRLMRARERLRARLTRRGLSPAGFATILPLAPAMRPLADSMAIQTARTSLCFASKSSAAFGTIPAQVTAMALGVLRTMSLKKLEVGMAKILACLLIMAGSAAIAFQAPAKRPNTTKPSPPSQKSKPTVQESKSILENGGFERGDTRGRALANWEKGAAIPGVQYLWDQTEAHEGRASLHLKKTAQRYFPIAQWFQEVKRQGKVPNLKVVAFVKAQKMTKAILDVQFLDRDGQGSHQWAIYIGAKDNRDKPATHDWKKYEGVVAIPEGTEKLVVAAQIYGPGDVWFDDVHAEYTDAKPTDATASNPADSSSKGPDPELADINDVPSQERKAARRPGRGCSVFAGRLPPSALVRGHRRCRPARDRAPWMRSQPGWRPSHPSVSRRCTRHGRRRTRRRRVHRFARDDELFRPLGDGDDALVLLPVVRGRRVPVVLGPDIDGPLVGSLAVTIEELDVEDGLRHLLGLDEGDDLEVRHLALTLDFLEPLGDREIALHRLLQVQARPDLHGLRPGPRGIERPGSPLPLPVGRCAALCVAALETAVGQDRLRVVLLGLAFWDVGGGRVRPFARTGRPPQRNRPRSARRRGSPPFRSSAS